VKVGLFFATLLFSAEAALAVDITTRDGTTYRHAVVTAVEPDVLHVTHSNGVARIPFEDLPTSIQQKYHYDPAKAVEYRHFKAERAATRETTETRQRGARERTDVNEGEHQFRGEAESARSNADRPAPSPVSSATSPGTNVTERRSDEFSKAKDSLVVISGERGAGSGFIAEYKGRALVFTNAHVLSGNLHYTVRGIGNQAIQPREMAVAKGLDVAVFSQSEVSHGLQIAPKVEDVATIGDEVAVLGNSLGAGVITDIRGKITGIGPDFVEVDAKFVTGNSGSPVIHLKSGTVVGIATLLIYREFKTFGKDSKFNAVERRFAQRIDRLQSLEATTPTAFSSEYMIIEKIIKHTDDLIWLFLDICDDGKIQLERHQNTANRLARPVREYLHDVAKFNSKGDLMDVKERFLRNLVFETKVDVRELRPEMFTGYHRKILEEDLELRKKVRNAFEQLLNIQTGTRLMQLP